jgi:hypothetical protein
MGSALSGLSALFTNPECQELAALMKANQPGLFLLIGGTTAALGILQTVLVLAVLSCRVPELRRQGAGCLSGFGWRLGPCLCTKRRKTQAELLEEEQEEYAKLEAGPGVVEAYLKSQSMPEHQEMVDLPQRPRVVPGAPTFPPTSPSDAQETILSSEEEEAPRALRAPERPRMHRREAEPSAFEASAFSTGGSGHLRWGRFDFGSFRRVAEARIFDGAERSTDEDGGQPAGR